MARWRPFVQGDSYMANKKWTPLVIGNGYTTTDGAGGPAPEYETVTGNPVSFNTVTAWPLKQLSVAFSPKLDLHGYDSPWPAGGGANKYDSSKAVANERFNTTGTAEQYGTTRSDYIPCIGGASYYVMNVHGSSLMAGVFWYDSNKAYINHDMIAGTSPVSAVVTAPANAAYVGINMPSANANDAAINYPATVTTYSPYSNICPILGWDSLNVYHSGADTSNPQTISITIGSTVYSGVLDVLTGVVTVDTKYTRLLSSWTWNYGTATGGFPFCYTPRITILSDLSKLKCDHFKTVTTNGTIGIGRSGLGYLQVWVGDLGISSAAEFKTYLDANEIYIVYPLTEPMTIQLTPQEVQSLAGDNTMWTDAASLEVTYRSN